MKTDKYLKNKFDSLYTCKYSSFKLFKKWFIDNRICKENKSFRYNFIKKYLNEEFNNFGNKFIDHMSFWIDENKKKHILLHPYNRYPKSMKNLYEEKNFNNYVKPENIKKDNIESLELFDKFKKTCDSLKITYKFYKSSECWYYPNQCIMIDLII